VTDDGTFEEFMAAALPGLLRFGFVLTGDPHRAEELTQAALVKTYRRWRHLTPRPAARLRAPRDGQHLHLVVARWQGS
jgi:DNA-directed RNA polymerase specialized sigma24 family protein